MYCFHKVTQNCYCNEILGNVLCLAEKYALGENIYFGYYNRSSAYGDDLLSSFIMEIEILRDCLKNIENFTFPPNLSKDEVLEYINNWEKIVPNKSKKYYKYLSEIISGKYYLSLKNEIKKKEYFFFIRYFYKF